MLIVCFVSLLAWRYRSPRLNKHLVLKIKFRGTIASADTLHRTALADTLLISEQFLDFWRDIQRGNRQLQPPLKPTRQHGHRAVTSVALTRLRIKNQLFLNDRDA